MKRTTAGILIAALLFLAGCSTKESAESTAAPGITGSEEVVAAGTERTDTDSSGKPDSLRPDSGDSVDQKQDLAVGQPPVYPRNPAFAEDDLLLTADQIHARNALTAADAGSGNRDMEQFLLTTTELSGVMVDARITSYHVPSTALYGDAANDASVRAMLEAKTNRGAIANSIAPRYAIITENCDVRSFPDDTPMTDGPGGFDMLQESMFDLGEVVVIGHETADGSWFFAYGTNYFGWIRADHTRLISLEEALGELRREEFVVFVKQYVLPETGRILRIGTKLPVSSYQKGENGAEGSYTVALPDGSVEEIPEHFVSFGYVPFNTANLVTVYKNSLGNSYGWGDTDEKMDCTSLIDHVYRCFGIELPRNSSAFRYTAGGTAHDVRDWSLEQREQFILNSRPGTILIMPGHAVTFLGDVDGVPSILHMVTRVRENGVLREPEACVISPLHGSGGSQTIYLEAMTWIITMP